MPPLKPPRAIQVNWSHPVARGLTGCWLLTEGTGDKIADAGPHRQHGSSDGSPLLWKPGTHGHCLEFDGTDKCVDCGTGKFGWDLTNELSIVAYFNHGADQTNTIFARSAFVRPTRLAGYATGKVRWWVYTDGTNCNITSTSQHATDGSEWIHAVGTWRQNDGRIYVNGKLENSESSSSGNLNFVNDSQPAGIGGTYEGGSYYYPWNGRIEYILVYNRALSPAQVKWLHREPFAMFASSISPAAIVTPTAAILLTGSLAAQSATSATLTSLTGISGSVTCNSAAAASLKSADNVRQATRIWSSDSLFNGMTANAFKLGTILSLGWFWLRTAGCSALYRGRNMEQVDFDNILAVAGQSSCEISPPGYLWHGGNSTYFYVVRRFNNCGYQEKTLAAAAKVSIGADGELQNPQPNKVFTSRVEQAGCNGIRLIWFYCPLEQKSPPVRFNVYYDNRTGHIEYETPLTSISYLGRKFYTYNTCTLTAGRYLFAIRAEDANGKESSSSAQLSVQLNATSPDPVEILSADCL